MRLIKMALISLVVIVFTACEMFPEGGLVKKADNRIEGTWKLSTYMRDGTNETSLVLISNYTEVFKAGGEFSRTYTKADNSTVTEDGTWELKSDNLTIDISGVSSISEFSDANSTLSTSSYTIVRMKKDEFWYEFNNGGNDHEFRMIKN